MKRYLIQYYFCHIYINYTLANLQNHMLIQNYDRSMLSVLDISDVLSDFGS